MAQFGKEVFLERATVLPTHEFFPDDYDGSEESIRVMFDRVCAIMGVDPQRVEMQLYRNNAELGLVNDRDQYVPTLAAGIFSQDLGRQIVSLDEQQIDEPLHLVGTIAHELAHARLRGENRLHPNCFDEELLTDLTAVFHGFGVFLANSPRHWDGSYTTWPNSELRKPEYMTLPMYGYALAHCAWHRGETRPAWLRHARPEVRAVFKAGLRYLTETGDSSFRPGTV